MAYPAIPGFRLARTRSESMGGITSPALQEYRPTPVGLGKSGNSIKEIPRMAEPDLARHRCRDRLRNFYRHRHRDCRPEDAGQLYSECSTPGISDLPFAFVRTAWGRAGDCALLRAGGRRMRICIRVLRGTRRHDPHRGQRVHLHLCHDGRAHRLDYRLGLDSGIRRQQHGRERRLFRPHGRPAGLVRDSSEPALDRSGLSAQRPLRFARATHFMRRAGISASTGPLSSSSCC